MDLLDLVKEAGLTPKREGKTFSSPCPACQGTDRFIIWPETNRYWCRRCSKNGDVIQFCRDFLDLDYFEACKKLNISSPHFKNSNRFSEKENFHQPTIPSELWMLRAEALTKWAKKELINSFEIAHLFERGLRWDAIEKFHLGLCKDPNSETSKGFFRQRQSWGLENEYHKNGKVKQLWLPYGIVIPCYSDHMRVIKLKIRRLDWHPDDIFPKYFEIAGSMQQPAVFGSIEHKPTVIVEAEFDAMLIQQEAGDLCSVIALGGAKKRPDLATHQGLKKSPLILYALDFDEAGKEQFIFWRNTYSQLRAWPVPKEKSPGDAFKIGINIRQWIIDGLFEYEKLIKKNL